MKRIIVDTSVWIDYLNDRDLPIVQTFESHLRNSRVCLCPPIIQEVLQGINTDQKYKTVKDLLLTLEIFVSDPLRVAIESAEMFRALRKAGITIRKPNDCQIAWFAIHQNVELFHNDSDFTLIARHTSLKLL